MHFEEGFFRFLEWLERLGVWLSLLAWLTVAGGVLAVAVPLRHERRLAVWVAALIVGLSAAVANLVDYRVTLALSPDLSLEANPLWRNVIDTYGLEIAKAYGLSGKILVSILAGLMFAFYLSNVARLFPKQATSPVEFLRRLGDRSENRRERLLALFTMFSFFFAGIQTFYFYIAYLNWLDDPHLADRLPSAPLAALLLIVLLAVLFGVVTYRAFQKRTDLF